MISNNVPLDRAALGAGCAVLANKKYKLHKALSDLNDENLIISSLRNQDDKSAVILLAFHLTENDKRRKLLKFIEIIQLINDKYVNPIILGYMDLNLEPKTNMFKHLKLQLDLIGYKIIESG